MKSESKVASTPTTKLKEPKLKANPLAALTPQKQQTIETLRGIPLSEIRYVAPTTLRANPLNSIFPEESASYFEELMRDIEKRGITDPLVAKHDGTLLTGHNRLTIALQLKLQRVPVRYVQSSNMQSSNGSGTSGGFTDEQEIEFVIKDNLLRRHLTDEQRVTLYERLYPNFHARRGKAITFGKQMSKGGNNVTPPPSDMLTVQTIAETTGQKPENVKQQLARYYRKHPEALQAPIAKKNGTSTKPVPSSSRSNTERTIVENSREWKTFAKRADALKSDLEAADAPARKLMLKHLKSLVREAAEM
jgi:hypothetical protein